jgi:hypothetical protein
MDLASVMDQVGDALDTIDGLRVYRWPADNVQPPAAVVAYPTEYRYDETFGRGMDRLSLPVVVLVGRPSDRAARDRIVGYAAGAGTGSVKAALEAHTYTACDSVRVESVEFDVVSVAGVEYLAATFTNDIAGTGA